MPDPVPTTRALLRRERLLTWSAAVLLALLFLTTGGSLVLAGLALNTRDQTAERASKRITSLQVDLKAAHTQSERLTGQLGEANTKIDALLAQLQLAKIQPVVTRSTTTTIARSTARANATTTSTTRPSSSSSATSTTTQPSTTTSTTTTSTSSPPTTTTAPCRLHVPGDGCPVG